MGHSTPYGRDRTVSQPAATLETSVAKIAEFIAAKTEADDSQHNENDEVQNCDQQPNTGVRKYMYNNQIAKAKLCHKVLPLG